jgi:hypothetical protein
VGVGACREYESREREGDESDAVQPAQAWQPEPFGEIPARAEQERARDGSQSGREEDDAQGAPADARADAVGSGVTGEEDRRVRGAEEDAADEE